MKDEDIVNVCSNMLLRPDITVAVAGCFRHILPQIVRNVVDAMRKRYNCRMNESIQDISCEDPLATDSWNLYVHEYVVVAFSRILELAPHLLRSVLEPLHVVPLIQWSISEVSEPHIMWVARKMQAFTCGCFVFFCACV
jgi:hypothetical protein